MLAPVTHAAPLVVVAGPLVAAGLLALAAAAPSVRLLAPLRAARGGHALVVASAFAVTLVLAAAVPAVLAHGVLEVAVPALLGTLRFRLDALGLTVALLAGLVWSASSLHASAYLADEQRGRTLRYHLTSLVTFAALLTVVSAADLITLYLGFEWLGLAAYLFVVHTGSKAAEAAGLKYLVLTLAGGFAVLTGALLVHSLGGGDLAVPLALDPERSTLRVVAAACLLVGFGVKAGALGLHTWLPDAHTAAPAPASALLSGVMLKAGAYGIARTLTGPFRADAEAGLAALHQAETLGLVVLWWGVATMLVGVVMALMQRHAKRLLAYSSVSQMGFVLAGMGAAIYLGEAGAIGWTGAIAHVVNHGLFKALLFLGVGAVITSAGSGDLASLGGLARRMPWTFALVLVGVAGIVGVPLLNGFVSKSVIHHAIDYAAAEGRGHGLVIAERLFVLTTVGTAAALLKLTTGVFLGRSGSDGARNASEAPLAMRLALLPLSVAVVALGLRPHLLAPLVGSALQAWGLPSDSVERWLTSPVTDLPDLAAATTALAAGLAVHLLARRFGVYERTFPAWASLDRAALTLARAVRDALVGAQHVGGEVSTRASHVGVDATSALQRASAAVTRLLQRIVAAVPRRRSSGAASSGAASSDAAGDDGGHARWPALVRSWGDALSALADQLDRSWRLALESGRMTDDDRERLARLARARIQRHSRDVGLAMALVVLVWLVMLASLAAASAV